MRIAAIAAISTLLLFSVSCDRDRLSHGGSGKGDVFDCATPKGYSAVTKAFDSSGACQVTWDVDNPNLDAPYHPEIGVLVERHDRLIFTHFDETKAGLTYHIERIAPEGGKIDESCPKTPFKKEEPTIFRDIVLPGELDPAAGEKNCHYKVIFSRGKGQGIDPHIIVGKGGGTPISK